MTHTQTHEWLAWVEHLHNKMGPDDVAKVVALGAERDELARKVALVEAMPLGSELMHFHAAGKWYLNRHDIERLVKYPLPLTPWEALNGK